MVDYPPRLARRVSTLAFVEQRYVRWGVQRGGDGPVEVTAFTGRDGEEVARRIAAICNALELAAGDTSTPWHAVRRVDTPWEIR